MSEDSEGFSIKDTELKLLLELTKANVPFMIVGMAAAIIQGSNLITRDIDLWFKSTAHPGVTAAVEKAGGSFVWRTTPQVFSGPGLEDVDIVFNCSGLLGFEEEYINAIEIPLIPGLTVKVLPIDRIIMSKKAANRLKDRTVIPALEALAAVLKES